MYYKNTPSDKLVIDISILYEKHVEKTITNDELHILFTALLIVLHIKNMYGANIIDDYMIDLVKNAIISEYLRLHKDYAELLSVDELVLYTKSFNLYDCTRNQIGKQLLPIANLVYKDYIFE